MKGNTNRRCYERNHGSREFRFWTAFMAGNKKLRVHFSKRVWLLKEFFLQDSYDNRVVKGVLEVKLLRLKLIA
jgi:hypothetical protein